MCIVISMIQYENIWWCDFDYQFLTLVFVLFHFLSTLLFSLLQIALQQDGIDGLSPSEMSETVISYLGEKGYLQAWEQRKTAFQFLVARVGLIFNTNSSSNVKIMLFPPLFMKNLRFLHNLVARITVINRSIN